MEYTPYGQTIEERTRLTLKQQLKKLERRKIDEPFMFLYKQLKVSPRTLIHQTVSILNSINLP